MPKTDIWMPWYIGDYQRDTQHLSCLEHGAYRLLIDAYWCNGGPISDNDGDFARICRLSLSDWTAIRCRVAVFFKIEPVSEGSQLMQWRHTRIDFELQKSRNIKERNSLGAKLTNSKRWGKPSPSESPSASLSDSHSVSPNCRQSQPHPQYRDIGTETVIAPIPVNDFVSMAEMRGIPSECATWYWNDCQKAGWIDGKMRPITDPWPGLQNCWKTWQENEHKRKFHQNGKVNGNGRPPFISELQAQMQAVQRQIDSHPANPQSVTYNRNSVTDLERAALKNLRKKVNDLNSQIANGGVHA